MEQELTIRDGIIYLKEYKTTKSMDLKELAKKIIALKPTIETPQLPLNTVKYKQNENEQIYYIHIPEDNYKIYYLTREYIVRFPHTILRFTFDISKSANTSAKDIKIFWTQDKHLDINAKSFHIPPLANIHTSGNICNSYVAGSSHAETIINYVQSFFTNRFNNDISRGKMSISYVASAQNMALKAGMDKHELVKLWWYRFENEKIGTSDVSNTHLIKRTI